MYIYLLGLGFERAFGARLALREFLVEVLGWDGWMYLLGLGHWCLYHVAR